MTKPTIKRLKLSTLVLDFGLYPRVKVDPQHSSYIAEALRAGAYVPPIIADSKSLRIADGFHRYRAYRMLAAAGDDPEVDVELRDYADEADLLRDALRMNSTHGRALTSYDRQHAIGLAEKYGLTAETIAEDLAVTVDRVIMLRGSMARKHASVSPASSGEAPAEGRSIPLKRAGVHLAGQELSAAQEAAMPHILGVHSQTVFPSQLILLIRSDMVDFNNPRMMALLRELRDLLNTMELPAAAEGDAA